MAKEKTAIWVLTLSNDQVIMFCSVNYILKDTFLIGRIFDQETKKYEENLTWINPKHIIYATKVQEE